MTELSLSFRMDVWVPLAADMESCPAEFIGDQLKSRGVDIPDETVLADLAALVQRNLIVADPLRPSQKALMLQTVFEDYLGFASFFLYPSDDLSMDSLITAAQGALVSDVGAPQLIDVSSASLGDGLKVVRFDTVDSIVVGTVSYGWNLPEYQLLVRFQHPDLGVLGFADFALSDLLDTAELVS